MGRTTRNGILALIGLSAFAWWKYKATPEEKEKIKNKLNTAKDNLCKIGKDVISKADDIRQKVK